jgi:prepilin-type N-terminal cleavage/methylation domain-containing protein
MVSTGQRRRRACPPKPWRRRAFSLLELLLVLAITVIIAAMAAPRYATSANRYHLDAAARRVAADLALAQAQARASSKGLTVTFYTSSSTYQVPGVVPLDRRPGTYTVDLKADPYAATIVSASFGGQPTLTFDMYGGVSSGGSVVVQAGGTQKTITVDANTGKASAP